MKYFKHLFDSAAEALVAIFYEHRHADKVVEHYFKTHKKWGKRDRKFFAEAVYGSVRWWNLYFHLSDSDEQSDPVDVAHKSMAIHMALTNQELPEWYKTLLDPDEIIAKRNKVQEGHLKFGVPEWIYKLGLEELGPEVWEKSLVELNRTAPVILRANSLKNTVPELITRLRREEIVAEVVDREKYPMALRLVERTNVSKTNTFETGGFEMQDGSSQLAAAILSPEPGDRVVDACAGAGGKSLHLAALMKNKGKITALDVVDWKLEELNKRAKRAGATIIETQLIDSPITIKVLYNSADALLLDVPCSGLGVLKRNPGSKWKLTPEQLKELQTTQKEILQSYSPMVKKGGRMVYATCSILPSENTHQVNEFLKNNSGWSLKEEHKIFPYQDGFDGFYIALLERSR